MSQILLETTNPFHPILHAIRCINLQNFHATMLWLSELELMNFDPNVLQQCALLVHQARNLPVPQCAKIGEKMHVIITRWLTRYEKEREDHTNQAISQLLSKPKEFQEEIHFGAMQFFISCEALDIPQNALDEWNALVKKIQDYQKCPQACFHTIKAVTACALRSKYIYRIMDAASAITKIWDNRFNTVASSWVSKDYYTLHKLLVELTTATGDY